MQLYISLSAPLLAENICFLNIGAYTFQKASADWLLLRYINTNIQPLFLVSIILNANKSKYASLPTVWWKNHFVHSYIYNHIYVVKKKIYILFHRLYLQLLEMQKTFTKCCEQQILSNLPTNDEIKKMQTNYNTILTTIINLLDDAMYLWEEE